MAWCPIGHLVWAMDMVWVRSFRPPSQSMLPRRSLLARISAMARRGFGPSEFPRPPPPHQEPPSRLRVRLAPQSKCLAQNNKSRTEGEATKKRETAANADPLLCPMKPTTKIRFTEPQIALVMRAHPNCNLDHLIELSFEFNQAGEIVDCVGTVKDGGNIDRNYAGSGLARLYRAARRRLTARQTTATIIRFPNGERLANA